MNLITGKFEATSEFAKHLDQQDPLARFRDEFHIPKTADNTDEIYFVGNSLGLQPKLTQSFVHEELERWQRLGVRGHFEGEHPWMPYHEFLAEPMANLIGANDDEVVMMNSLTTNLHLMMVSFYRPTKSRNKILIENHAFPSDHYAVESQIRFHGFDPAESMLVIPSDNDDGILSLDAIEQMIERHGDQIAMILLPAVQYYTGQVLPIADITKAAQAKGILIGFDLAHAAGNIPMALHDWGVDFAAWCTYKYLNSGPGSVGGCFVHQKHCRDKDLPRFAGWWGHNKQTRFMMENKLDLIPTAEGWQLSNPPILSLAAIRASLKVFKDAGGMRPLCEKSVRLTGYFEWLINELVGESVEIITPIDPSQRGCQLSLKITTSKAGKSVHENLEKQGVMTDWREPNVIRAAPVPLYNSYHDVFRFVEILKTLLD